MTGMPHLVAGYTRPLYDPFTFMVRAHKGVS
jgi:hypothetical protein